MTPDFTGELQPADLRLNPPKFEQRVLDDFVAEVFGQRGELSPLKGERDQNLRLTTTEGSQFVVKVAGVDEDDEIVDFQVQALLHIHQHAPELKVPRVIPTLDGGVTATLTDNNGSTYQVRLLSWLPGIPFWGEKAPSLALLRKIGEHQGQLSRVLASFQHSSSRYFMPWDSSNGLVLNPSLATSVSGDVERLVVPLLDYFEHAVLPAMKALRQQVIHNDAHTGNMLKSAPGADDFVGLIDFGDMIYAPLIQDLAVTLDSLLPGADDPLETGAALLCGYHQQHPLHADEIELLYDAVILRGALTVQLYDLQLRNPEAQAEYYSSEYPGVVADFERNLKIDREQATERWLQACE